MPKYHSQDKTDETHTKAGGGWSDDHKVATTEFIIADRDGSGSHEHIAISDGGDVITDTTGSL